jgi:hypothetical protein
MFQNKIHHIYRAIRGGWSPIGAVQGIDLIEIIILVLVEVLLNEEDNPIHQNSSVSSTLSDRNNAGLKSESETPILSKSWASPSSPSS